MRQAGKGTDKLAFEREMEAYGARYIAGADEAGRGPLAGPVVCAAVIMPLAEEALIEVDIGECTWAEADGGVWIMLRAEIDYDGIVYDTENTLREQASWYIFESVVNGWTENMQFMTGDTYDSIDVADVFG